MGLFSIFIKPYTVCLLWQKPFEISELGIEGAINRVMTAWRYNDSATVYLSAESGIVFNEESDEWSDIAITLGFIPYLNRTVWSISAPVIFPTWAVEQTYPFTATTTVGKTLCGTSREEILTKSFIRLLGLFPNELYCYDDQPLSNGFNYGWD